MTMVGSGSAGTAAPAGMSARTIALFAIVCGAMAANLYYEQPLATQIATELGLSAHLIGLVVTLPQIGYGLGLLLLVPLGDLIENRRLVLITASANIIALLAAAVAPDSTTFLAAGFAIGITTTAVQMLVPLAANMAPEARRGQIVGTVMSGLFIGVLLSRPIASLVGGSYGWRTLYALSAGLLAILVLAMARGLPTRQPTTTQPYPVLIASLWGVWRRLPVLRRRAYYQGALFAAFSLFWTTIPIELAGPGFDLDQRGIALFALAGIAGALAAPFAGRLADRGWTRPITGLAIAAVLAAFPLAIWGHERHSVGIMLAAAMLLDFGGQTNVVLGQRTIFALDPAARSRLNGLFIGVFFLGGALGSALSGWAIHGGWLRVCLLGGAFPLAVLLFYIGEWRRAAD